MLRLSVLLLLYSGLVLERVADRVFVGVWQSPLRPLGDLFFASLPGIRLPLWDLLLLALLGLAYLDRGALRRRSRAMDWALALCLTSIALWCLWGVLRGGSAYQMFFQLHALVLLPLVAYVFTAVLRGDRGFLHLGITILAAALTRACLGVVFYFRIVPRLGLYPPPSYVTSHDDSVLFVAGIVIVVSYALARQSLGSMLALATIGPVLLFLVTINQRRLAWIALATALVIMYALLPRGRVRRRIAFGVLACVPLLSLYVLVGRGRSGGVFAPLHALTTIYGREADDSSRSRDIENAGLVFTLRSHPLLGTGWGHEYTEISEAYAAGLRRVFPQYRYIPHNSVLAAAAFMGPIGFTCVWAMFPVACLLAARSYRFARRPVARAATMSAVPILMAYLIQGYGDMGVQSVTSSLIGGACIAAAGRYAILTGAWPRPRPRPAASAPRSPAPQGLSLGPQADRSRPRPGSSARLAG